LAAGVLLAVSAAMNWRFGMSLGRTEFDGQIYGAASAAADCLKALVPFFFFAAIRNRMWSQAAASAVVWTVVTAYSLTSALGHAGLNRLDVASQRKVEAQTYADLRTDLAHAREKLAAIPHHRPAATIQADIDNAKNQRAWGWTKGCAEVAGKQGRQFCEGYLGLVAEQASALESVALENRIAGLEARLATSKGSTVMAEADPQAAVLAKLTGVDLEKVQIAMTIFIALLLEVGSGFGMYIAFSQWRLYDRHAPAAPRMASVSTAAAAVAAPVKETGAVQIAKPRSGANDNKSAEVKATPAPAPAPRLIAPENDVERYYKEKVDTNNGSSVTATQLYEDYCAWCETKNKEPMALPTFGREFGELGVKKERIAGRVRYIGIALRSDKDYEEDKKLPALRSEAA
jgi:BMFP domain-containing protein YqiC